MQEAVIGVRERNTGQAARRSRCNGGGGCRLLHCCRAHGCWTDKLRTKATTCVAMSTSQQVPRPEKGPVRGGCLRQQQQCEQQRRRRRRQRRRQRRRMRRLCSRPVELTGLGHPGYGRAERPTRCGPLQKLGAACRWAQRARSHAAAILTAQKPQQAKREHVGPCMHGTRLHRAVT